MSSRRNRIKGIANIPQRRQQANKSVEIPPSSQSSGTSESRELAEQSNSIPLFQSNVTKTTKQNELEPSDSKIVFTPPINTSKLELEKSEDKTSTRINPNLVDVVSSSTANIVVDNPQFTLLNPQLNREKPLDECITSKNNTASDQSNIIVLNDTIVISCSDTEFLSEPPPPPPSPTKINRSRIKAIPRFRQRHPSLSASESEDETVRKNRVRTDSICSTTSVQPETIPATITSRSVIENLQQQPSSTLRDTNAPQISIKKQRKTEYSRRLYEARRDYQRKFGSNVPDRQKLTMLDLLFYNPNKNVMSHHEQRKKHRKNKTANNNETMAVLQIDTQKNSNNDEQDNIIDEDNDLPAPQIKIGPEGNIVIDERSLVVENKAVKRNRAQIENSKLIDGNMDVSYGVFKRRQRVKEWNREETLRFYKALNSVGTDFTLMAELFPRRTRIELKRKFKKEERNNRALVDRAMMHPCNFDFQLLKSEAEISERELEMVEKAKSAETQFHFNKAVNFAGDNSPTQSRRGRKPSAKHKTHSRSQAEDSDKESSSVRCGSELSTSSDDESEKKILQSMHLRPTRSGRIPKVLDQYSSNNCLSKNRCLPNDSHANLETKTASPAPPGSLLISESKGPEGEPIFDFYMVTDDDESELSDATSRKPKDDISGENKHRKVPTNIFRLSIKKSNAGGSSCDDSDIERNVTIPAHATCAKSSIANTQNLNT